LNVNNSEMVPDTTADQLYIISRSAPFSMILVKISRARHYSVANTVLYVITKDKGPVR